MPSFLIDEDLPRGLAASLQAAGFEASDVRDVGLRGASDSAIHEYVISRSLVLVTADLGFSNILRFPLQCHYGIVVVRFPNELAAPKLNRAITDALSDLGLDDFAGTLVVIEPGRTRVRRHH